MPFTASGVGPSAPGSVAGTGLCLSGGGYRAMLYHVGALWRLHESGHLGTVKTISSVSGGSIAAGKLALVWPDLFPSGSTPPQDFETAFVNPMRTLADHTVDIGALLRGTFAPGRTIQKFADALDNRLFGGATLQSLPSAPGEPLFVINATNLQSGAAWYFTRPYMGDHRVGRIKDPTLPLSLAVACSGAFPPTIHTLVNPGLFEAGPGFDLTGPEYRSNIVLSDGGVYDNLGLEPIWSHTHILVSDGGSPFHGKPKLFSHPIGDIPFRLGRALYVIQNQERSLRKQQILASFREVPAANSYREGAYWGIASDIANYQVASTLNCPVAKTGPLANIATRLKCLDDAIQERLINWGYAICDAALRKHVDPNLAPPAGFPYPAAGV